MKNRASSRWQWSLLAIGLWASVLSFNTVVAQDRAPAFRYDGYAAALGTYVDDQGMVNYRALKAYPEKLEAFLSQVEQLDRKVYDRWTEKQQIAFWINMYNALTLKAIITHYPIKSSWKMSLLYPKNSIRQISGVWDKLEFTVMGRKMTLDNIEHDTLRKLFNEPRIHMALVCAAMGCPPLLNEPYTGMELGVQLDGQTRRFLRNPEKFRIARDENRIYLSSIFKWFGEDFVQTYGRDGKFSGQDKAEGALLNFISHHLDEKDRESLITGKYAIKHLDYDWSLNEQEK